MWYAVSLKLLNLSLVSTTETQSNGVHYTQRYRLQSQNRRELDEDWEERRKMTRWKWYLARILEYSICGGWNRIFLDRSVRACVTHYAIDIITSRKVLLRIFQRGPSNVSANCSLQENEASQGLHILPRVDTGRSTHGNRKQRQDRQTNAL